MSVLGALACGASTYLAWGAVSPLADAGSTRAGSLSGSPIAVVTSLGAAALGWWAHRRGTAAAAWMAALAIVPWLPLPASGALLLWHGPAGVVLLGAGALAAAWPWVARVGAMITLQPPRVQALIAFVVAALLYGVGAWRMQPQLPAGDEPHYLVIAQSLLSDHDLRIENNHRRGDYRAYLSHDIRPDYLRRGVDGEIYSIHAPGTAVLVLPAFAVAGYRGVVAWLVLLSAGGALIAWLAAYRLTGNAGAAWAGWGAVALSAPFFFQAFTVYPDGPGAVLVMAAAFALVVPERLRGTGTCAGVGVIVGALPWLHTRYAIVAIVLSACLVARAVELPERRGARLVALLLPSLVSFAAWFAFFHAIYGTFNPAAPYGGYTQSTPGNAPRGLSGLLVDQQFGLLPNAPVYWAALAGLAALWRTRRRLAVELGLIVVPYAAAVASYHMWWGGQSAPARFLVPVLLPLAMPVAASWHRGSRVGRAFITVAVAASASLALGLAWIDRGALVYNVRDGYARWLDAVAPLVRLPLALPSLFRGGLVQAWTVAFAWIGAIALAFILMRWLEGRWARRVHSGGRRADTEMPSAAALGVAMAVTVASTVAWTVSGAAAVDRGAGLQRVTRALVDGARDGWRSDHPLQLASGGALAAQLRLPSVERRPGDPVAPAWMGVDLPPGRYELSAASGLRLTGRIAAIVGRGTAAWLDMPLEDAPGKPLPFALDLPAGAELLRVVLDEPARRAAGALEARLVSRIDVAGRPARLVAQSAARYGASCWFLDHDVYPENAGFWVRGETETLVVVDGGAGRRPELSVAAGPVATTLSIGFGTSRSTTLPLGPGERRRWPVPAAGPVLVRLGTTAGFRPSAVETSSTDSRWLGVFVEVH